MNKVILIGNLTKDPELRTTQSGKAVTAFNMAVQRKFRNDSGDYDADFISCIAWGKTAEFISQYFKKGNKIGVVGSIQTRTYEKDGRKVYVTEVNVEEAEFVESKKADGEAKASSMPNIPSFQPMPDDDDCPF